MGTTTVTSSSFYILYGAYQCSRCGNVVRFNKPIISIAMETRKGLIRNEEKLNQLKTATSSSVKNALPHMVMNELTLVEKADYQNAHLRCSCACGNKELWATFFPTFRSIESNNPFLLCSILSFLFIIAMLCIAMLILKEFMVAVILGCILGVVPIYGIIAVANNDSIQKKCTAIQSESKPRLFLTEGEREAYIIKLNISSMRQNQKPETYEAYKPVSKAYSVPKEDIPSIVKEKHSTTIDDSTNDDGRELKDRPRFCRKCGAPLLDDSVYCDRCGTKIVLKN